MTQVGTSGNWLLFPPAGDGEEAAAQSDVGALSDATVVLFPYAGGGRGAYPGWVRLLRPARTAVVVLPGRDHRMAEAPAEDLVAAAAEIARELADAVPGRFALFGHSLGAVLGYEVARALEPLDRRPEFLMVSDRPAPDAPRRAPKVAHLPDPEFRAAAQRYGWLAGVGRDPSPELLDLMLQQLRADLRMSEAYSWNPGPPLDLPVHLLTGSKHSSPEPSLGWSRHSTGPVRTQAFDGGHFFIFRDGPEIVRLLQAELGGPSARPVPDDA